MLYLPINIGVKFSIFGHWGEVFPKSNCTFSLKNGNPASFTQKTFTLEILMCGNSANYGENMKNQRISRKFKVSKMLLIQANICWTWLKSGWLKRFSSVVLGEREFNFLWVSADISSQENSSNVKKFSTC